MRVVRILIDVAIAHCGGSYVAALVALPASLWFGFHDPGVFLVGATAPVSFPAMAFQAVAENFGRQFILQALTLFLPAYLLGFLFTLRFCARRRSRRAWRERVAHGLCGVCGYNLTGNTSGVCPECGRAMA